MAAYDPRAAPFWEDDGVPTARSKWQKARDDSEMARRARLMRLFSPHLIHQRDMPVLVGPDEAGDLRLEDPPKKRRSGPSLTYRELRDRGLCTQCEAPSTKARCDKCWARYNEAPCRTKLRSGEATGRQSFSEQRGWSAARRAASDKAKS